MEKKQSQNSKRFRDLKIGDYIYIYDYLSENLSICHVQDIQESIENGKSVLSIIFFMKGGLFNYTTVELNERESNTEFIINDRVVYSCNNERLISLFTKQIKDRQKFINRLKYTHNE